MEPNKYSTTPHEFASYAGNTERDCQLSCGKPEFDPIHVSPLKILTATPLTELA